MWCVVVGALLMAGSGAAVAGTRVLLGSATETVTQQNLLGETRTEVKHVSVKGAKTILLVGLDTRPNQDPSKLTRSDSIILLHVPADHKAAYLVSLPRDSYVRIPKFDNGKVPYAGGNNKINAAFAYGSRGLTGDKALTGGFTLLAKTVKNTTGITPDAGAIIDFQGFRKVVNVLGKVCMNVDTTTTSIHIGHDNDTGKISPPYRINPDGTVRSKIPGVTPNIYKKGDHCFTPTEALDFVRQRDLLKDRSYDYGRQRHQQQFLKAILTNIMDSGLDSPTKLPGLLSALGKTMTVDDGGIPLQDWVFALRGIRPDDLVTIKTNNGTFNSRPVPGVGSAEILSDTSLDLLKAVKNDSVDKFILDNPTWVTRS
ncbi:cell envelope-related transcriptional attenuator [Actinoplanes friuliensis DSM 7358]|uniref:Cell envelope-related transcriptional attenuator n=1 Tax=Actinoplanes friuliensis DSM 7358 TaxID=1246995 RepID=U5W1A2_9ACTN|nr:cell envelope-related transcriptional attenuator [Actinoplanes friuliensis DSM 7358]